MAEEQASPFHWEWLRSEQGPGLKIFGSRFDYYRHPVTNQESRLIVVEAPDAANVVAVTKEGEIVMVRQFRFGARMDTLEVPGGNIEPEEPLEAAARRELEEETGYVAEHFHYLGWVWSNPAFMTGKIHHWLATDARPDGHVAWDEGEAIEVKTYTPQQIRQAVAEGQVSHPHALSALGRVMPLWDTEPWNYLWKQ